MPTITASVREGASTPYTKPGGGAPLTRDHNVLRDHEGRTYSIKNGVPILLEYPAAESDEQRSELHHLAELAQTQGTLAALHRVYGEHSDIVKYVTKQSRQLMLDLLPLTPKSQILEVGSGLGQFTIPLAQRCGHVCAIEVVQEHAEFSRIRAAEAACTNVDIAAAGDGCRLPFPDGVFDGAVLNLVLEWCGMRESEVPLVDSQRRMLRETWRTLKPGGFLFVATKNRFALRLLLGKSDGHAWDLHFGSALPKPLLMYLLRRRGFSRTKGQLHSHRGFKALLREARFRDIRTFWAIPDMRWPEHYFAADPVSIREARRTHTLRQDGGRIIGRLAALLPARLVPHLANGNVALAYKPNTTGDSVGGRST